MFVDKVKSAIHRNGLLRKNDAVVVGVSGGPDSLALLYALDALRKEYGLRLHVCHLDHGLRKDSAGDLEFVKKLALKMGLEFTGEKAKALKAAPGSVEEAARNSRHEFFFRVAAREKADAIALGHTLDDQAETVLMRLVRGSGLLGLTAMVPLKRFGRHSIIRPLLGLTRKEVEGFLKRKKVKPRIDSTNSKDIYLRNRVRKELLPLLKKKYNRNIKEVLAATAQNAGYDYDYLLGQAQKAGGKPNSPVSIRGLFRMHPSLRRLVLRLAIGRLQGNTRLITFRHIQEIEDLLLNRPANSVVDLPRGISVRKRLKTISFYRR